MTAPTPSPKAPTSVVKFEPSGTRRAAAEFFRSITLGSPEWVRRMEGEVRAGNKQIIRLLEGYLHALPQSLREAVLAARVVAAPQVRKDAEAVFQTREPR